jgi:hypothetical protein
MRYIDLNETAKLVRSTLATAFPNTTFSVRSKRYSGGCSIDARWTDGPTGKQVTAILDRFEGKGFDGMTDMSYSCGKRTYKGEPVEFCGAYIRGSRILSPEIWHKVADRLAYECGVRTPTISQYGCGREADSAMVPFAWFQFWNKDATGNETPLTMADIEKPGYLLASDSHGGSWFSDLANKVAYALSLEEQQPVDLPEYIREEATQ